MREHAEHVTDRMTDRVLYALLVGAASGAASLLATRAVQWYWRRSHGAPPKELGLFKSLGGRAGKGAAQAVA